MKATSKRRITPRQSPPKVNNESPRASDHNSMTAMTTQDQQVADDRDAASFTTSTAIKAAVRVRPLVDNELFTTPVAATASERKSANTSAGADGSAREVIRVVTAAGRLTRPLQGAYYTLEVLQPSPTSTKADVPRKTRNNSQHSAPNNNTRSVSSSDGGRGASATTSKAYAFDYCAGPSTTQEEFFTMLDMPAMCEAALSGQVVTVFCFGQTGSGKTYTLSGRTLDEAERRSSDAPLVTEDGLQYQAVAYVARRLKEMRHDAKKRQRKASKAQTAEGKEDEKLSSLHSASTVTARCSYVELYQETLYDLLQPDNTDAAVRCRWSSTAQTFYVEGSLLVECHSRDDFLMVLREGQRNRQRGSHAMNRDSSRSHVVFTIFIEVQENNDSDTEGIRENGGSGGGRRFGRLVFVDLAGSERLKKSQSSSGAETGSINKSLFTLGRVLELLSTAHASVQPSTTHTRDHDYVTAQEEGEVSDSSPPLPQQHQPQANSSTKSVFIPYRSSILTQLLMQSLDGHGRTLMVACVSPSSLHLDESLRTLHYAQRARHIRTTPIVHVDAASQQRLALEAKVRALQRENALLRSALGIPRGSTSSGSGGGGEDATVLSAKDVQAYVEALRQSWVTSAPQQERANALSLSPPQSTHPTHSSKAPPPPTAKKVVVPVQRSTRDRTPQPAATDQSAPSVESSRKLSHALQHPLAGMSADDGAAVDARGAEGKTEGAGMNILALLDALPDTRPKPT